MTSPSPAPMHLAPEYLSAPALEPGGVLERIAYLASEGAAPTFVWCGGLMSDMRGTKAEVLHGWAREHGCGFVRFDYYGHGESTGAFTDGTISRWARDTLQVVDELTAGPVVLLGSSMGGWVSLLAARARPERVRGLILINPAPDFTEALVWPSWTPEQQHEIQRDGVIYIPSDYGDPYPYTWALMEDGRANLVMEGDLGLDVTVEIFSGDRDEVVPSAHCRRLADALEGAVLHVVEGADHSLSREEDLELLRGAMGRMVEKVG